MDGFDAVEVDNLDTWTRFTAIDESGAHALAASYVERAHAAGLSIGQKNAAEVAQFAHDTLGFDFAVTEECAVWDECGAYTSVYGRYLLQIEYPDALTSAGLTFDDVCARTDRAPLPILRDRDLVPPDDADCVYASCAPRDKVGVAVALQEPEHCLISDMPRRTTSGATKPVASGHRDTVGAWCGTRCTTCWCGATMWGSRS